MLWRVLPLAHVGVRPTDSENRLAEAGENPHHICRRRDQIRAPYHSLDQARSCPRRLRCDIRLRAAGLAGKAMRKRASPQIQLLRSEERRVGKEGPCGWG